MNHLQQDFSVRFSYTVFFTEQLFATTNTLLSGFLIQPNAPETRKKLLMVLDSGVVDAHPQLPTAIRNYFAPLNNSIDLVADFLIVPGGERAKNDPALVEQVVDAVDGFSIDRHSFVVAIGGGSVLDMVGYAAAISHRGIRHIRIPTTVLSQNDSGVGVKNGVNYRGKKNFLGTFAPPVAVFNDSTFLTTLDDRDWRAGISEAVKVALIKDRVFFDWIDANAHLLAMRDGAAMSYLVHRCAEMHLQHIAGGDPFEMGSSRPLDFGHWSAHKLEQLTNFELRHGEAVAIGIALDTLYSNQLGWLSDADTNRVLTTLRTLGFSLYNPLLDADNSTGILRGLSEFREHLGGQLTIMLLKALGTGVEVHEMDADGVRQAIATLRKSELSTTV
ncbi:3-dehydroquinate synthase [Spirosoma utsteinense]|uniref:3-dehydroquinate synthase n=1 Tax=Spirosoma utsteinense TaxID=2585773 RepID=A0ABR6WDC0_9BACT|nr:3-dehydroquinate synthase [Spirosoma utsteinense]MBC3786920.1 3-dehydroquinate synthase [Spirosoma utsteinense]MBC3794299.1 3-dehydroquinate synthase [Spirosoma utsteinense]